MIPRPVLQGDLRPCKRVLHQRKGLLSSAATISALCTKKALLFSHSQKAPFVGFSHVVQVDFSTVERLQLELGLQVSSARVQGPGSQLGLFLRPSSALGFRVTFRVDVFLNPRPHSLPNLCDIDRTSRLLC